jgi:hypothetical protein
MIVTCDVESAPHLPFHRARPLCRALTFVETDMADYFTHFSCVLDVGTPDNAARALDLYPAFMKEAAREGTLAGGFQVSIHPDQGGTKLWMRDEVTGDPLQVIIFVQRCAEVFSLTGRWGFQWALCRYRHKAHYAGIGIMPHGRSNSLSV